ncbi:MAG: protein kinase domain-containing protein [Pirellulaceae bacterium]
MTDETTCPKCHTRLPADAPAGICPRCLMEKGLETTAGHDAPLARQPQPGETFGPYHIGPRLGSGGMGAVYAATHIPSGRRLALKVLNHQLESTAHRQRFLREGRLAASVNHPNSVYIFGTEEIAGTPVIAMELAGGGTLQDRIKREGPLPVSEAVDAVLQIVEGLEAAQSAGVLHRDVKPSNCFLEPDGTVKVGDFGLSISTTPRAETNLTQSGIFLGTPAFSSPEQLRGDELDARSDIYSVGVTLFYLLTGRTPFEAKQLVSFLATVLERPAPSPTEFRPAVPAGLAKVVQRCLEKQRSQRFSGYDEFRQALLPYASTAPTPATLGFRVLAFSVDLLVLVLLAALLPLLWARDWSSWQSHFLAIISAEPSPDGIRLMLMGVAGVFLQVGYFALGESVGGTTVGKFICRLRVVGGDREPPGLGRGLLRSSIFFAAVLLPWWIAYAVDAAAGTQSYDAASPWTFGATVIATLALFTTSRRRNGYAGFHELASGTRVVSAPRHQRRPALKMSHQLLTETEGEQAIGPYHVLGPLETDRTHSLVLGYDARLLRKVWIRTGAADLPPLAPHVRDVSRIGRLRWLDGQCSPQGGWEAYEAPSGKPLLEVIGEPQSWDAVRFWLLDVAEELNAGRQDDSLPPVLDLDRVWITADGRAKVLDFRAPRLPAEAEICSNARSSDSPAVSAAIFLKRLATAALEGRVVSAVEVRSRELAVPIPVSARSLINDLGRSADASLPVAQLRTFTQLNAAVSRWKRAAALLVCFVGPLTVAACTSIFYHAERQILREHPEVGVLAGYLDYHRSLEEQDARRSAIEIIIADRFRAVVTDLNVWSQPAIDGVLTNVDDRQRVESFLQAHPKPTAEQIADAERQLAHFRAEIAIWTTANQEFYSLSPGVFFLGICTALLVLLVIIPGLVSLLLTGNSLLLRSLDVAIVTKDGATASRLRVLWRQSVLWFLVLLALAALIAAAAFGRGLVAAALLTCAVGETLIADRGIHERLAGTWLVPR